MSYAHSPKNHDISS